MAFSADELPRNLHYILIIQIIGRSKKVKWTGVSLPHSSLPRLYFVLKMENVTHDAAKYDDEDGGEERGIEGHAESMVVPGKE